MPNFTQTGGVGTYHFGLASNQAAIAGVIPEQIKVDRKPEFEAEGKNVEGMTSATVTGPAMYEISVSGYLTDDAAFKAATTITFDGRTYTVTKRSRKLANAEFVKAEISGVHYVGTE